MFWLNMMLNLVLVDPLWNISTLLWGNHCALEPLTICLSVVRADFYVNRGMYNVVTSSICLEILFEPELPAPSWWFCLLQLWYTCFFFFFFSPDITCLHCKDMYASAEWRLWKGATPPGVLDVRSLCPLLPASGKSFYKLPPTPAAISTQVIPVLTANMQKFGVWPPCLLTQTITCSGKGTNEPFCRERVSSGASATAAHKTWQYPNSQMWGQKLERLSWWEHRVISSLLPLLVFGFVYPSELNLME